MKARRFVWLFVSIIVLAASSPLQAARPSKRLPKPPLGINWQLVRSADQRRTPLDPG